MTKRNECIVILLLTLMGCQEGSIKNLTETQGLLKQCDEIGDDTLVCEYQSKKGVALYRFYFANDDMFLKETLDPNGTVVESSPMVNGMSNGLVSAFWPSGILKGKGYVKDSLLHGEWTLYDSNGYKSEVINHVNGFPEGKMTAFYSDGS